MSEPPRQQQLFGDSAEDPPVLPAPADEDLVALAKRLPPSLRLGTSSWSFPGWRGIVYARHAKPQQLARHGLHAYARHPLLRAVSIDRTFYGPLQAQDFAAYAAVVPGDFRFLVKAMGQCTSPFTPSSTSRSGQSNPHYLDEDFTIDRIIAPAVEGLGELMGTLLFQFPPQQHAITKKPELFADRLAGFLGALPRGLDYAVELRDAALMTQPYFDALTATGAHHCYSIHPRMPSIERQREMAPRAGPVIARWMLQPPLNYRQAKEQFSPFANLVAEDPGRRDELQKLCADAILQGADVMVTVNNKAEGSAPLSIFALAQAIATALETHAGDRP